MAGNLSTKHSALYHRPPGLEFVTVTPTLDTSAYATNDVLFNPVAADVASVNAGSVWIHGIRVLDADDNGQTFDLFFCNNNTNLGTINDVVSITDANATQIISAYQVQTTDYSDLVASQVAFPALASPIPAQAKSAETNIYLAGVLRSGTPTYTASGITIILAYTQGF